ncbi:hypothetical protein ACWKWN_18275 [Microbacterium trichothecenolyticum]
MGHVVTRNAVKVSIGAAAGNKVASLLRRGDIVPEGVAEEQLADLVERGFLEEVETGEAESDAGESGEDAEAKAAAEKAEADAKKAPAGAKAPAAKQS